MDYDELTWEEFLEKFPEGIEIDAIDVPRIGDEYFPLAPVINSGERRDEADPYSAYGLVPRQDPRTGEITHFVNAPFDELYDFGVGLDAEEEMVQRIPLEESTGYSAFLQAGVDINALSPSDNEVYDEGLLNTIRSGGVFDKGYKLTEQEQALVEKVVQTIKTSNPNGEWQVPNGRISPEEFAQLANMYARERSVNEFNQGAYEKQDAEL